MKRHLLPLLGAIALMIPASVFAMGVATQDVVTVAQGETKSGTYFAAGNTVTIQGTIDGDLVCAATTVNVTGTVRGDILCAAQNISITGPVSGSVRVAAQNVNLGGTIARNVMVASQTLTTANTLNVAGDFGAAAQTITVGGIIAKELYSAAEDQSILGTVGSVMSYVTTLNLGSEAQVKGDLAYHSREQSAIDQSKVGGQVKFTRETAQKTENESALAVFYGKLFALANYLIIAAALLILLPRATATVVTTMQRRAGASMGWGSLVLLAGPIAFFMFAFTIIGIGLVLLSGGVWLAVLMLSTVFAGIAAGQWLLGRLKWQQHSMWWAALIGISLLVLLGSIPVVGFTIGLLAAVWAMGGVILAIAHAQAKNSANPKSAKEPAPEAV